MKESRRLLAVKGITGINWFTELSGRAHARTRACSKTRACSETKARSQSNNPRVRKMMFAAMRLCPSAHATSHSGTQARTLVAQDILQWWRIARISLFTFYDLRSVHPSVSRLKASLAKFPNTLLPLNLHCVAGNGILDPYTDCSNQRFEHPRACTTSS